MITCSCLAGKRQDWRCCRPCPRVASSARLRVPRPPAACTSGRGQHSSDQPISEHRRPLKSNLSRSTAACLAVFLSVAAGTALHRRLCIRPAKSFTSSAGAQCVPRSKGLLLVTRRLSNSNIWEVPSQTGCQNQCLALSRRLYSRAWLCVPGPSNAWELPFPPADQQPTAKPQSIEERNRAFEESDLVRSLRQKTDENRVKNKVELQNKYCYRQAELGVGDCAGLRLIPGATKSGKQKTPEFLKKILQPFTGKDEAREAVPLAGAE